MDFGQDFFDFNTAESSTDLIPANTVAPVIMTIKPGGKGEEGWLRQSKSSDSMMLDCEFTIVAGRFAKRKVFQLLTVSGGKLDDKGNSIGGGITRTMIRGILESARGVNAKDNTDAAQQKRRISRFDELNGIEFLAKIGIEKSKDAQYDDKNKILCACPPGTKEFDAYWKEDGQQPFAAPATQQQAMAAPAPTWAPPAATQQAAGPQQDMTPPWAR